VGGFAFATPAFSTTPAGAGAGSAVSAALLADFLRAMMEVIILLH